MKRGPRGKTRYEIFAYVKSRLKEGNPPTIREVQEAFHLKSVQTARVHLNTLVKENKLMKIPGIARGYRLTKDRHAAQATFIPVLGNVHAGDLNLACEEIECYIPVNQQHTNVELFALRIEGDSMIGQGILPGDTAIIRKQPSAAKGDIVVVLVEGEASIKTYDTDNGKIVLRPENPKYDPIYPDSDRYRILGKVIEIRRCLG